MRKITMKRNKQTVPLREKLKKSRLKLVRRAGFGLNEVLGIAAAVIIAAVIVIPGLKIFAESLMNDMEGWWDTYSSEIFVDDETTG